MVFLSLLHTVALISQFQKTVLFLTMFYTVEYDSFCLMASLFARRLMNCSHSPPMPPFVPMIKGVNVPCSISKTLCVYSRFFAFSCSRKIVLVLRLVLVMELTCVTLTSKKCCLSMLPETVSLNIQTRRSKDYDIYIIYTVYDCIKKYILTT